MLIATRTSVPRKARVWYKNLSIRFSSLIPERIVNTKQLIVKLNKICAEKSFYDYKYGGILLGAYGKKDIVERSVFGKPTLYQFETI